MANFEIDNTTLLIASQNEHKIAEFRQKLKDNNVLSLNDIGYFDEIEENGTTFEENSLIKAKTISEYLQTIGINIPVIADDAGLCVNALNGAPGVYSARYNGNSHDVQGNRDKLLKELEGVTDRSAYFCCALVKYYPDGHYVCALGKTFGHITLNEIGDKSFGYDCLFYSDDLGKTFGESTMEEKNKVSHRGRAIEELLRIDK